MKKLAALIFFIIYSINATSQWIGGYHIYDFLVTAVHPYGCDPSFVTGPPEDSTWVNFSDHDTMTGNFGGHWVDGPGNDLLLETSHNRSNYYVRLLKTNGTYSTTHNVLVGDWTQIGDTLWHWISASCFISLGGGQHRYILPLDFQAHFGLTSTDTVKGIEIVFLDCPGAPDLAGVYILQPTQPCDLVHLGPDTTLCEGEYLMLNALKPNSTYLWQDNSTNPTFMITLPGTYWVRVTEPTCTTSDTILVNYDQLPLVTNSPLSKTICTGEPTNIPLTSGVPNTTFYWTAALTLGVVSGFSADSGLVINQVLVNTTAIQGIVNYHITPKAGRCVGEAVDFRVTVTPGDSVKVTITASGNNICAGIPVTFTATPTNGGSNPAFQWMINGFNVGTNNPFYTYIPSNGDTVACLLTSSNLNCITNNPALSDQVIMVINGNLPVFVAIAPSLNPVCAGIPVIFTATPTNGGGSPQYQWKVNGINVGANSPTYNYIPVSGDLVSCILNSSLPCTSNNPSSSNPLSIYINAAPLVTFLPCFDTITTVNAKPFKLKGGIPLGGTYSGPGVNPASGIWNPATGAGTITITYSYTNVALCSSNAHIHIFNLPFSIFNCGSPLTDIRDNQVYQTVHIGAQCWMADNLKYGTEIPDNIVQRDNCIPEKYSRHVSPVTRYDFYQWDELMQYDDTPALQGLCPPGWHVPTEADWNQLSIVYNGPGFAGSQLLSTGFSGFNAVVNGSRFQNASWNYTNFAIHLWSSTAWGPLKAWAHAMNIEPDDHSVSTYPASRADAFVVRCMMD